MEQQNFTTKWNWGAFIDPIGFAIGNRAYLGLLALIPILNIVWIFISGAKGEQWALSNHNNEYRDEEEFRKVMDSWKRAGFVQFLIFVGVLVLYLIIMILAFSVWSFNIN
ncbi:ribonuclease G [Lactococcus protaetiae]|uniref:Ribonuclease G n=1 Tax=Lactococcus protaetiae TaxID=2592653 RepID=A0A514Z925_9LACT|nr:ribonuclease G [Lactococcus protaetiae]MCL2112802.1 ribonuclease G [Streptococcaceae bacterium]QDK71085.1 ribonuclease G [Lactococcus protaetiae]